MTFTIYDVADVSIWSETHPAVQVNAGLFNAVLGSQNALPDSVFSGDDRYLGISVGGDPEISPRTLLTAAPGAAYARRVAGDIATRPGLMMLPDINGDSAFVWTADGVVNSMKLSHLIEMSGGGDGGASIYMFNPQPEPPASPLLTMNTGGTNSASIRMFNPQPEPPAKLFELNAEPTTGAGMSFFDDAGEVMGTEPSPFNSGFTIKLFNPQPEPPAALAEMSSTYGLDGASGKMAVYDPQNGLESRLTPGNLSLQYSGPIIGPPLSLQATALTARIGIGVDAPGFCLEMKSNGMSDGMRVNSSDGSQLFRVRETSGGGCETFVSDADGNTGVLLRGTGDSYFTGGNVGIGSTEPTNILTVPLGSSTDPIADAWTTYSSKRWKENIQPLHGSLEKVLQLKGVSFDWREGGKHDIGLIAEEVGVVIPEVVAYEENAVDAQSIDYGRLVTVLIEAMKEQQGTIEELKQKNENLTERIELLEGR